MKHNQKGFTLIEIIVVIVMIGVLAAIAVPIYTGYVFKARASEAITTLGAVKTFMLERRLATGKWPEKGAINEPGTLVYEFNGFKELFYFDSDIIYTKPTTGDIVKVELRASDNFGLPANYPDGKIIGIQFSYRGESKYNYWYGDLVEKYASHLPEEKDVATTP